MFTVGEPPQGCGNATRTVHQGLRSTATDFITKGYRRDNITTKTDVTVNNVVLSDTAEGLQASGVASFQRVVKLALPKPEKKSLLALGLTAAPQSCSDLVLVPNLNLRS